MNALRELVRDGVLQEEAAALAWLLAERGVPCVVAGPDREQAAAIRHAVTSAVLADQPARDAVAGGVVVASSLEEVLRMMGAGGGEAGVLADEARDLGVVLVVRDGRLVVAHYVRPVERDGAGHLQRRPPAVLGAWNEAAGAWDDFWWALTDELATRAGMSRADFEDELEARARQLTSGESVPGPHDARH